jgi:hypothetical protein
MVYFFDISNGATTRKDETGTPLSGPEMALIKAALIAVDLAHSDPDYEGYTVRVRDEHGKLIGRIPVLCFE